MSLPDSQLDPPEGPADFTCTLCGDVKPYDDQAPEAFREYDDAVCTQCWLEVAPSYPQEPPEDLTDHWEEAALQQKHPPSPTYSGDDELS